MGRGRLERLAVGRNVSIRWLLVGCYALLFGATVAGLGSVLYLQLSTYLERAGEAQLRRAVVTGLDRTQESTPEGEEPPLARRGRRLQAPADFEKRADDLARGMGSRVNPVRILSATGSVLAEHPSLPRLPEVGTARVRELQEAVGRSGWGHVTWYESPGRRHWRMYLLPLYRGSEVVGFVQIACNANPDRELLMAVRLYLIIGVLVACVMGLAVAFWLSRVISRPLERLATTTHRVAEGDLEARTGLAGGSNEIFVVAGDFDHMVERLQEAFAAQRRFVADASHELKTPLTAIGGMAEMLAMGADGGDPDKRRLALATMEKEVDRMSRLVTDLLTLARAEQGPGPPPGPGQAPGVVTSGAYRMEQVDIAALLAEAAEQVAVMEASRQVEVRAGPLPPVLGDRDHLGRVLRNLVENAVKYSPEGGMITLAAHRDGADVVFEVTDRGPGIEPAELPHVFEPFYRADRSRARRTGGSGLGLSIVRAIVDRHHGRVDIESTVGVGTTVRVRIPAAGQG